MLEPAAAELLGAESGPAAPGIRPDPTSTPASDRGGVALLAQLSRAYFFREEHRRAIEIADRALAAGERLDLVAIVSDT